MLGIFIKSYLSGTIKLAAARCRCRVMSGRAWHLVDGRPVSSPLQDLIHGEITGFSSRISTEVGGFSPPLRKILVSWDDASTKKMWPCGDLTCFESFLKRNAGGVR